jgi:hypothetical protein
VSGGGVSGDLERRYRRVLRLLPGYYRERWEEDMVATFLDSRLTGSPEADARIIKDARPGRAEVASVAGLAARLYLGAAGTPHRYFTWGQAIRRAVLAVVLVQAVRSLDILMRTAWSRHLFGWLPAPPASMAAGTPGGILPPAVWYLVAYAWIVSFVALTLRQYRTAQVIAALAIVPDLIWLLQGEFTGFFQGPSLGPWAFWVLLNLAPVLAMTAFHRDAPPAARWPWLLALPVGCLLVYVPLVVLHATGNAAWVPDFSGLYCVLVILACLVYAPRAWFLRRTGPGVWSLTLALLAADAGAYRILSITDYLHDPHLIEVSLAELLILVTAVALVTPAAARAQTPPRAQASPSQTGAPAPLPYPQPE